MSDLIRQLQASYPEQFQLLFPHGINAESWAGRRDQLSELFSSTIYGRFPLYNKDATSREITEELTLPSGHLRSDFSVSVPLAGGLFSFDASLYLPGNAEKPIATFLFLTRDDWTLRHVKDGDVDEYFPLKHILDRGFAVATVDVTQAAADDAAVFHSDEHGMRPLLGQSPDQADRLGALGIWAFTAMRVLDALSHEARVDSTQVIVIGLSRLGKAALLAGAFDDRFNLTVSINSGHGGAALAKLKEGENIEVITTAFPHWFCPAYAKYAHKEQELPVDQHCLLAMVAPRYLYITSSANDSWADPLSEFRSAKLASAVYEAVYGLNGLRLDGDDWDAVETDAVYHDGQVAYHRRTGEHGLNQFDWDAVMDFAILKKNE